MLIGTAGHIDHGKTTLVKALTGVDADRLPQEKARGITLDLGYAYTPLADGSVLGFVDVPGHEKLVHNMLAGATAIDFVLLAIAADDGPMPQTREHLELLDLLGLRHGAIALTKTDTVSSDRLAEAQREVARAVSGTGLSDSPVFPVSGLGGEGVAELRAHLETAAKTMPRRPSGGRFRLAIDRSFSLKGVGTVVTGTAHAGTVTVGDTLVLSPPGLEARVRGLHVQDRVAEDGRAGDRCALALKGDFEKKDIKRGMWLVDSALQAPLSRFQGELRVPGDQQALKHMQTVHVHLGTEDIIGRVALLDCRKLEPGGEALVEILLERETSVLRGDRFILRDAGAQRTVGGGRVLDIFPPARHKRTPERLVLLEGMRGNDPAAVLDLLAERSPTGVDLTRFALGWNLDDAQAGALWRQVGLQIFGNGDTMTGLAQQAWDALRTKLLEALGREHEVNPDMIGVEPDRLRRLISTGLPRPVFDALIAQLLSSGVIVRSRTWLHLPAHRASVNADDRKQFAELKSLLDARPYNPPRVRDVSNATGARETDVRQLFKRLARAGELYPVAHDHYFTADAVAELAGIVDRLNVEQGAARAATFRDMLFHDGSGGRKVAIRILEFFDRVGYTRRIGDDHVLRQKGTVHEWTTS
jgi:selenocysteine-specific elongation factor